MNQSYRTPGASNDVDRLSSLKRAPLAIQRYRQCVRSYLITIIYISKLIIIYEVNFCNSEDAICRWNATLKENHLLMVRPSKCRISANPANYVLLPRDWYVLRKLVPGLF